MLKRGSRADDGPLLAIADDVPLPENPESFMSVPEAVVRKQIMINRARSVLGGGEAHDPVTDAFVQKYGSHYGRGLIDRLASLEKRGVRWYDPELQAGYDEIDLGAMPEYPESAGQAISAGQNVSEVTESAESRPGGRDYSDEERQNVVNQLKRDIFGTSTDPPTGDISISSIESSESDEMMDVAIKSSSRWPRIYRPPRVRGGHVILDLCSPDVDRLEVSGSRTKPLGGRLERHVSLDTRPGILVS